MGPNEMEPAVLLGMLLQGALWAGGAGEPGIAAANPAPNPELALARYLAAPSQAPAWATATIDIQASIPRLAEHGHLRAIRRSPKDTPGGAPRFGRPEYQVLEMEGDRTVRQQVIARYLSAEVEAAAWPPASVAITPANYRFRYRGSIANGGTLAYIFEINPKKKRSGLIRGELWIDSASGLVLRQSGYLVRSPSIFVRRVEMTRDTAVRDGVAYERTTRLEIDTRLVGRAEMTITERPYSPAVGDATGICQPSYASVSRGCVLRIPSLSIRN